MVNRKKVQKEEVSPINSVLPTKHRVTCKNVKQKEFYRLIKEKEIVVCSGPAGTGKSHISIATAIELIQSTDNPYSKLVIIKPAVESSDKHLGFLKGDLRAKLEPYAASSLSIIDEIIGKNNREELEEIGVLCIDTISFLRGKTFNNAILIMEEAQNMSINEMKTLLTRIGENSKFIISGDIDQSDRFKNVKDSGLYDATIRLKPIDKIGFFTFNIEDVVRNPIISEILSYYKGVEAIDLEVTKERGKKISDLPTQIILNESDFMHVIKPSENIETSNKITKWFKKYFK